MTTPSAPERHRTRARLWGACGVIAVLAVAALLRLWALGHPGQLVFDELYYVRDAASQLAHGYPTTWPDVGSAFGGERARAFTDLPATIAHPPLGKWLIGLGMLALGVDGAGLDSAWGWRIAVALAGVLTVGLTMRLGWLISRSIWVACTAGLLLAIDGVHVVMSRVGLLDGFLTLFVVLGALFMWRDYEQTYGKGMRLARSTRQPDAALQAEIALQADGNPGFYPPEVQSPPEQSTFDPVLTVLPSSSSVATAETPRTKLGAILWRRPWLLAAGLTFGAAAGVKWSGLYPLAGFLILITIRDLTIRYRVANHPWLGSARQALVTAAIALPAAFLAYLASWIGWIINPGGQDREAGEAWWVSLWQWHAHAFEWHSTLSVEHPYQANPLGWPIALRPTGMYWQSIEQGPDCHWSSGCVAVISSLPNPLVTWGGVVALVLLIWVVVRALIHTLRRPVLSGEVAPWGTQQASSRASGLSAVATGPVWAATFVLVGYLSGWLPWVFTFSRSAVFQFYAVVLTPFAALALALVLCALCRAPNDAMLRAAGIRLDSTAAALLGRRVAVAIFLLVATVLAILFFPIWSGMPVAEWFWRGHLWLPGWW